MNLGEIGENVQLNVVQNVNEVYDIWKDLNEDELQTENSQNEGGKTKLKLYICK